MFYIYIYIYNLNKITFVRKYYSRQNALYRFSARTHVQHQKKSKSTMATMDRSIPMNEEKEQNCLQSANGAGNDSCSAIAFQKRNTGLSSSYLGHNSAQ